MKIIHLVAKIRAERVKLFFKPSRIRVEFELFRSGFESNRVKLFLPFSLFCLFRIFSIDSIMVEIKQSETKHIYSIIRIGYRL